jgi:hypothetical protein
MAAYMQMGRLVAPRPAGRPTLKIPAMTQQRLIEATCVHRRQTTEMVAVQEQDELGQAGQS